MKKFNHDIALIERKIQEKYGDEAIMHPKALWNKDKEAEHTIQSRELYSKETRTTFSEEIVEFGQSFISKKILVKAGSIQSCPVCLEDSFDIKDDVYFLKYKCCFKCYLGYVEGREERWKSGWRPHND